MYLHIAEKTASSQLLTVQTASTFITAQQSALEEQDSGALPCAAQLVNVTTVSSVHVKAGASVYCRAGSGLYLHAQACIQTTSNISDCKMH